MPALPLPTNQAALNAQRDAQIAANAVAKLKGKVIRVLSRETEEIEIYLQGPSPDVDGALARVAYIKQLVSELENS